MVDLTQLSDSELVARMVKFTCPDPFKGDHKLLRTWLFHMNKYTELCGITISTEKSRLRFWDWRVLL